ncbi:MAG: YbaK/EbsC family protein [Actinophytocola sp.]|uniref:YbaK/EbsC family protein n=1 Tax=Actinophytocola sp. TaxID=1872138 RepID=UPI003D6A0B90
MGITAVRGFLAEHAPDVTIVELAQSSNTQWLSAEWNIAPAQIAKTLSLSVGDRNVLLVACGDSRLDNRKVRAEWGGKARMLAPEVAERLTGHPVGGVCPFGLATPLPVYCDIQLKAYDEVVPAAGSTHAAMRINPVRMAELVGAAWVDVCKTPDGG